MKYKITALTPLLVGGGQELAPIDYMVWKDHVSVLDQRKHVIYFQVGVTALFVAWCLIADWRKNRILHPVFVIGGLGLILSWPLRMALVASPTWQPIGEWLVSFAK